MNIGQYEQVYNDFSTDQLATMLAKIRKRYGAISHALPVTEREEYVRKMTALERLIERRQLRLDLLRGLPRGE